MPRYQDLKVELDAIALEHVAMEREAEGLQSRIAAGDDESGGLGERLANVERGLDQRNARYRELNAEWQSEVTAALDRGELSTEAPEGVSSVPAGRGGGDPRGQRLRAQALRANDRAGFLPERAREHMESMLRSDDEPGDLAAQATVALADRDYLRAFCKVANDPVAGGHSWTDRERQAVQKVKVLERSLNLGVTGTAGGFLVPYELDPQILIANAGAVSPLRQIAKVVTTTQNEKRFVTSLGVTSTWTPEETEQTDDAPTLLQPAVVCKKGAAFVPVSYELYEDSDIATQVGGLLADAKAVQEALGFTLTQTNGPTGLITALVAAGGSIVVATGTNVLAQGDLYTAQSALPARWRPNAKWMLGLPILNGFRQLPQATGLNYSIVSDATAPPTILGWPAYENSNMDSTLTGATADYLVVCGDFQQFAIVDRWPSTVELIPNLVGTNRRPTAQRGFYMHFRTGSGVLVPDAFRLTNWST